MCKVKEELLFKIYNQIEHKKTELGEPTIHNYDDGTTYLHFFDQWEDGIVEGVKSVPISKIGNVPDDKNIQMVFSKKGTHVPLHDFNVKKTYVVIRGKINFFFENDDDILLNEFSSTIVPKGKAHGGDTLEDTFVLVIEDQCECEV